MMLQLSNVLTDLDADPELWVGILTEMANISRQVWICQSFWSKRKSGPDTRE